MVFIGIDAATKTGWAIVEDGKVIESGVEDFSKKRGESNGMMFVKFRRWINEMILSLEPHKNNVLVVYEQAHFRGGAATEVCVGLQTRVQEVSETLCVPYASVTTSQVKKFATGKGNAGKAEMEAAAEKHLSRMPVDDNEADAVHIAMLAEAEYGVKA